MLQVMELCGTVIPQVALPCQVVSYAILLFHSCLVVSTISRFLVSFVDDAAYPCHFANPHSILCGDRLGHLFAQPGDDLALAFENDVVDDVVVDYAF